MVQRLASTFGGSDGYVQVVFKLVLSDKVIKAAGSKAGVKWYILNAGFA